MIACTSPRRLGPVTGLAMLALAGCAGGGVPAGGSDRTPPTTAPGPFDEPIRDAGARDRPTGTADPSEWTVAFDVRVDGPEGDGFDAAPRLTFDPAAVADPFGEFASCAGLWDVVGAYSVFVSGGDGGSYVGVWTADRVAGAGIYDADIRVERGGESVDATGTITLAEGLQAGTFVGFGAGDVAVEGGFECSGAPPPAALVLGDPDDGILDTVEVFALLRGGDSQRLVSLATASALVAGCPDVEDGERRTGPSGGPGPIVHARGGVRLGSIQRFELTAARILVEVGDRVEEFAVGELNGDGRAAAFGATTDAGVTIDGAFRCT